MMKKEVFSWIMFILTALFPASPGRCSQDTMGMFSADVTISATSLHEWMPSVTYNPIDNEFMVLWHSTGVRDAGGANMYSLHGQRISPDGELLGEPFLPLPSAGTGRPYSAPGCAQHS